MLTQVLTHLHNFFPDQAWYGGFQVQDGALDVDFIAPGQYFRVQGSLYNDGVHQWPAALTDEVFTGTVTALRVPKDVVDLADDIAKWQEQYAAVAASPYLSERLGEYSYTKGSTYGNVTVATTWQIAFRDRLRAWRKI